MCVGEWVLTMSNPHMIITKLCSSTAKHLSAHHFVSLSNSLDFHSTTKYLSSYKRLIVAQSKNNTICTILIQCQIKPTWAFPCREQQLCVLINPSDDRSYFKTKAVTCCLIKSHILQLKSKTLFSQLVETKLELKVNMGFTCRLADKSIKMIMMIMC